MTREEAIEVLKDIYNYTRFDTYTTNEARTMAIKALEQEPKTGHWIIKRTFPTKLFDEYLNEYKCSECYREIRCTESQLVNYPYCHCGAKMESEET